MTSCVCTVCLPNRPSFLAPLRSPHFLSSGSDPWMESSTKMLIGRKLKKNQLFVNVHWLCARSRTAAGRGWGKGGLGVGSGSVPESLDGRTGPAPVLCAHATDGRRKGTARIQTRTPENDRQGPSWERVSPKNKAGLKSKTTDSAPFTGSQASVPCSWALKGLPPLRGCSLPIALLS